MRDSPALAVTQALHGLGVTVTVTGPKALGNARGPPDLNYVDDPVAAVDDADLDGVVDHCPDRPGRLGARIKTPKVIYVGHP
ncbi:hypothetical protein ACWD5W_00065 [Streptomyces sp. NPDC002455]